MQWSQAANLLSMHEEQILRVAEASTKKTASCARNKSPGSYLGPPLYQKSREDANSHKLNLISPFVGECFTDSSSFLAFLAFLQKEGLLVHSCHSLDDHEECLSSFSPIIHIPQFNHVNMQLRLAIFQTLTSFWQHLVAQAPLSQGRLTGSHGT